MSPSVRILLQAIALGLALSTAGASYVFAQAPPASAQSQQNHSAHHPEANVQATPGTPPAAGPAPGQAAGMPMGNMQQMMSMMRSMMTMMGAQSGMMSADIEGRIASLKATLKITDAQTPQWNRFADALRVAAKSMNGMFEQMMQPGTAATLRLERHEKMLTAHLNSVKTLREAADPLYALLSDDQKKVADALMVGPMGMM